MQFMNSLFSLNGIINTFLLLCVMIGGFFAFRYGQKKSNIDGMKETIDVLTGQMAAMKESLAMVKEENVRLKTVIETISSALKQKGILITIEGEMVTLEDGRRTSSMRHSTKTPAPANKKIITHDDIS
jgi:hypothetical protein